MAKLGCVLLLLAAFAVSSSFSAPEGLEDLMGEQRQEVSELGDESSRDEAVSVSHN